MADKKKKVASPEEDIEATAQDTATEPGTDEVSELRAQVESL